jgi:hypothetical protein
MTSVPITFVYEVPSADSGQQWAGPEFYREFMEQLGRHAGQSVTTVYGKLRDSIPPTGFILLSSLNHPVVTLSECEVAQQTDLAARLIPVGVGNTRIFDRVLEKLSVAAAISELSFWEWNGTDCSIPGARGLHGRRDIGNLIGANCLEIFSSERYCYLQSTKHYGLPHLLADYLTALARPKGRAPLIIDGDSVKS